MYINDDWVCEECMKARNEKEENEVKEISVLEYCFKKYFSDLPEKSSISSED